MQEQRAPQEAKSFVSGLEAEVVEEVREDGVVDEVREVPAVQELLKVAALDKVEEVQAVEEVREASAEEMIITETEPELPREILALPAADREDDWFLLLETVPRGSSYLPPGIFLHHLQLQWFWLSLRTHKSQPKLK